MTHPVGGEGRQKSGNKSLEWVRCFQAGTASCVCPWREPHNSIHIMTAIVQSKPSDEFTFVKKQFNKVAWRRSWLIGLAFGVLGAVANSNDLKTTGSAFGYAVGYGGAVFVMGSTAAIAFGKSSKKNFD